ncbi:MAG: molybdopterin-dependent oxidoreductase [Spirochaetaceae bacterium]|jgi:xanthine dehydrogenase large subunit|nr:molybdopterin-dependent oxidoreductase [Spirochaetaceae bacterium]
MAKMADTELHVRGLSRYVDDQVPPKNCLYCVILYSAIARGRIISIDVNEAQNAPGIVRIITAGDIPGENQIGSIILDEPLLAEDEIHYMGQPIAAVYGDSESAARRALKLIQLQVEEQPAVIDPRIAYQENHLIAPPRTFSIGDADLTMKDCDFVASGRADSGAQEHFYLEGQAAFAFPAEGGGLLIQSSTQGPSTVQKMVSRVCGLPMNAIEVDVRRLGGAFGGKEDQANAWACFAALGTKLTGRPCRMVLRRSEDMLATGKRHPYSSDFTIGLNKEGKILAFKAMYYQNAGAAADLSTAILERTLFHSTGSYYVPHVQVTAVSCKTNLTPNTAFRGFGGPQAMFVFEAALREASRISGISVKELQKINLIQTGQAFPYGMKAENARAQACWERSFEKYQLPKRIKAIEDHPAGRFSRGYSLMPVCFGISFTNITLNQARALVHIYLDGTVGVSTGAIEMGQGVNQKIREIVSNTLGISLEMVKTESTNTTRVANSSPTAASSGADLNGKAAEMACQALKQRILNFMAEEQLNCPPEDLEICANRLYLDEEPLDIPWKEAVEKAYAARVHLSAEAHYSTPDLHFDTATEKGRPFAYHSYGCAYTELTLDRLLGSYSIDLVQIIHDLGRSINSVVDLGQIEGGLVQGIGWMTMEEMLHTPEGKPLTATAGSYKVPDISSVPQIECEFLRDVDNPQAVMGSKAVGEPPFMYGIGAYFALRMAAGIEGPRFEAPMTPERIFMEMRERN